MEDEIHVCSLLDILKFRSEQILDWFCGEVNLKMKEIGGESQIMYRASKYFSMICPMQALQLSGANLWRGFWASCPT